MTLQDRHESDFFFTNGYPDPDAYRAGVERQLADAVWPPDWSSSSIPDARQRSVRALREELLLIEAMDAPKMYKNHTRMGLVWWDLHHPEKKEDEVFLTNMKDGGLPRITPVMGWRNARVGVVAYDRQNRILTGARPVFIRRILVEAIGMVIKKRE